MTNIGGKIKFLEAVLSVTENEEFAKSDIVKMAGFVLDAICKEGKINEEGVNKNVDYRDKHSKLLLMVFDEMKRVESANEVLEDLGKAVQIVIDEKIKAVEGVTEPMENAINDMVEAINKLTVIHAAHDKILEHVWSNIYEMRDKETEGTETLGMASGILDGDDNNASLISENEEVEEADMKCFERIEVKFGSKLRKLLEDVFEDTEKLFEELETGYDLNSMILDANEKHAALMVYDKQEHNKMALEHIEMKYGTKLRKLVDHLFKNLEKFSKELNILNIDVETLQKEVNLHYQGNDN